MNQPHGTEYKMVQHCTVYGDLPTIICHWEIKESCRNGGEKTVLVIFTEPRKRNSKHIRVDPDNIRYTTIESMDGSILYDSRDDIPCDMEKMEREQTAIYRTGCCYIRSTDVCWG